MSTETNISLDSFTEISARSAQIANDVARNPAGYRVLTGERPTGPLHLGHYFGTINERVRLQRLGVETFLVIADYQVVTDRDSTAGIRDDVLGAVADYLAAGLDPLTTTIFTHSAVPALNQLMLPFLSLVTEPELLRNPTVKGEIAAAGRPLGALLLTYPVHQAADILFCKGNLVPVGKDNVPHVEQTRTIARRFNDRYGTVFPVPDALVTASPHVSGLDGRKMSKSYGNVIALGMDADQTAMAIRKTVTDSNRHISYDPENRPGVSALLDLAGLCLGRSASAIAEEIGDGGAGALKKLVTEAINERFAEHRERRREFASDPELVLGVLRKGNARANEIADATLAEVRSAMGMTY